MPVGDDAGGMTWVPAWFAILVVGIPMVLAAICFLFGHTVHGGPANQYRQMMWDRTGWFLLGAAGMAGGLIAWWSWT